jgi:hypothetical protein
LNNQTQPNTQQTWGTSNTTGGWGVQGGGNWK